MFMLSSVVFLVVLLSCHPGGRRKMSCRSFCSMMSHELLYAWMPIYFPPLLLVSDLGAAFRTPSESHPSLGCRLSSVCHVLSLLSRSLDALCLLFDVSLPCLCLPLLFSSFGRFSPSASACSFASVAGIGGPPQAAVASSPLLL